MVGEEVRVGNLADAPDLVKGKLNSQISLCFPFFSPIGIGSNSTQPTIPNRPGTRAQRAVGFVIRRKSSLEAWDKFPLLFEEIQHVQSYNRVFASDNLVINNQSNRPSADYSQKYRCRNSTTSPSRT